VTRPARQHAYFDLALLADHVFHERHGAVLRNRNAEGAVVGRVTKLRRGTGNVVVCRRIEDDFTGPDPLLLGLEVREIEGDDLGLEALQPLEVA
jgi:hypothetical protein